MPQQRSIASLPQMPSDDGVYADIAGYGTVRFKPGTTPEQVDAAVKEFIAQQQKTKADAEATTRAAAADAQPMMLRSRTGAMYPSGTVGEYKEGMKRQDEFAKNAAWAAPTVAAGLATGGLSIPAQMAVMGGVGAATGATRAAVEGRDVGRAAIIEGLLNAGSVPVAAAVSEAAPFARSVGRKLFIRAADPELAPAAAETAAAEVQRQGREILTRRNTAALDAAAGPPPTTVAPMPAHSTSGYPSASGTVGAAEFPISRTQGASTSYRAGVTPEPLPTGEEALTMGTPPTTTVRPAQSVSRADMGEMTGKELQDVSLERGPYAPQTIPVAESPADALARIVRERELAEAERRAAAARLTPDPSHPVPTAPPVGAGDMTVAQPSSAPTIGQANQFTATGTSPARLAADVHRTAVERLRPQYAPRTTAQYVMQALTGPKPLSVASHVAGRIGKALPEGELFRQALLQLLLEGSGAGTQALTPMPSHEVRR